MKKVIATCILIVGFLFHIVGQLEVPNCPRTVKDIDGNIYEVINIGGQCWMAENLRSTHYADGTSIAHVKDSLEWCCLEVLDKAFDYYIGTQHMAAKYGVLYNWAAANGDTSSDKGIWQQGICPNGWHIPTDNEWAFMEQAFEQFDNDRTIAASVNVTGHSEVHSSKHMDFYQILSCFCTNAAGYKFYDASYDALEKKAAYWSATEVSRQLAVSREFNHESRTMKRMEDYKGYGFSVRCVKDVDLNY